MSRDVRREYSHSPESKIWRIIENVLFSYKYIEKNGKCYL